MTGTGSLRGRAGDHADFERFFARHHRELARLAFLLCGDPTTAEDLAAEAFVGAWERWATVQRADKPIAYVRRILVNRAATRVRRQGAERRRLLLLEASDRIPEPGRDPAVALDVRAAVLRLPPGRRACVVLRHAFDLSEGEVAQTLGISVGTVKSQTFKGMAQLQRILESSRRETDDGERALRRAATGG